ncbi:MAG: DUF5320 domain-containing protein [Candidatus Odinarchaeia archaeon]
MSWQGRGRGGRQGRYRNMYYLTGLPGFLRFGYSPGWIGRSPTGLGPAAQYLAETGQLSKFIADTYAGQVGYSAVPLYSNLPSDQRKELLKQQYTILENQLKQIKKQLDELEKSD